MPRKRNLQDDLVAPLQDTKQNTVDLKKAKPRTKKKNTKVVEQEEIEKVQEEVVQDVVQEPQEMVQEVAEPVAEPLGVESVGNMQVDVDVDEALHLVKAYETSVPRIVHDSISAVIPKDLKYAGDLKTQNILLKTQLQTLAQDYQELQTKFTILQSSGVQSASLRFEELKNT